MEHHVERDTLDSFHLTNMWEEEEGMMPAMSQTPMLTTPEERVAMFQQLFSDTIPHNKALGIKVLAIARGLASMQLEWRKELVGNPETGVLAGGPLTAMLDSCCGMAVATHAQGAEALRHARPAHRLRQARRPGKAGDRRGRVLSHHPLGRLHPRLRPPGRSQGPVAAAAGTFMLGTKGEATRAQAIGKERQP